MSVIDEIASAFDTLKKVATGEASLEDLGEKIFGPQAKGTCSKGVPCALEDGHDGPCKPVRAVSGEGHLSGEVTAPQAPQAKRAAAADEPLLGSDGAPPAGEGSG